MLNAGSKLGPYEIVSPLGAGGMGEVYRARDTRLKREVAIKVLPDALADDSDRLARFRREAELLAALNHPNIAAVYGLEEVDGVGAIVLELVEGDTLAERLQATAQGPGEAGHERRGGLPLDEALAIARQIADALEAAHEKGVIHRDLKPANIKVTPEGKVKVLDFGLAKMLDAGAAEGSAYRATLSPTLSVHATHAGLILGTAAYMSPEQARGKPVDRRTDIWAFGCVLFEMLSGTQTFDGGETVSDAVAAILKGEPDWSALPAETPAPIRTLLRRCLQKDPQRRLPHIGIARIEIDEGSIANAANAANAANPTNLASPANKTNLAARWRLATAVLATLLIAAAVWLLSRPAPIPGSVVRLHVNTPASDPLVIDPFATDLVVSPDGSRIVYVAGAAQPQLYVRALDQLEATPLRGTQDARGPFLSPDGEWVGYFQGADLKKVSIRGGPAVTLCQQCSAGNRGGSWGPDDTIIFTATNGASGLIRIPASGGAPTVLAAPDRQKGEQAYRWPEILPGGRAVLFVVATTGGTDSNVAVLDLKSGARTTLLHGGSQPHYVSSGYLVYAIAGTLRAAAFDLDRLTVAGNPVPVLERVVMKGFGAADFSVSRDGSLVYVSGDIRRGERILTWVDRQGREEPIAAPPRNYLFPRLSPDGTKVALDVRDQENDIWTWDFKRGTLTRVTFNPGADVLPVWAPDGLRIAFGSNRTGAPNLFWQRADGTGAEERLTRSPNVQMPVAFAPDGKGIVYRENDPKTNSDLNLVSVEGDHATKPLLRTPFNETDADISPDARWIAYESNESSAVEVYVRPFPAVDGGRWQISAGGGTQPLWARNGRELFYLDRAGRLMSAPIQPGATFSVGTPVVVTERRYAPLGPGGRTYDVSPDGRRFLRLNDAARAGDKPTPSEMIVVLNWNEELKRLVSSRR